MTVQAFQEYIEKHCPNAVLPVEFLKLARGALVGGPFRLLLDSESCLSRLYGGSYTDWVSGGQWTHMLSFLHALSQACFSNNIHLVVCFNGAVEKTRLHEWVKRQVNDRKTSQQIVRHIHNKGTPPPKVWFLPPVCMAHCVRLALLKLGVKVVQTMEDHHLEVLTLYRKNAFHGLVAHDSDYALSNISQYFSSQVLKLSRDGRSITTSQYLLHEVAKHFSMQPSSLAVFAALLGNHILQDEDLTTFYWNLLGTDQFASAKVCANQMVLPPCDVVIKAVAIYVCNIKDITDFDAIAKDVFKNYQACTKDKVDRFRSALKYYSAICLAPSFSAKIVQGSNHCEKVKITRKASFKKSEESDMPLVQQAEQSVKTSPVHSLVEQHTPLYERAPTMNSGPSILTLDQDFCDTSPHLSTENKSQGTAANESEQDENCSQSGSTSNSAVCPNAEPEHQKTSKTLQTQIPSLLTMPIRKHMDISIPPLPEVAYDVLKIAEHRHKIGLMHPSIYHVLTKGEIKISVTIEDDTNMDLPSAVRLFRPIRQHVYGVLFSVSEARNKMEKHATRQNCLPEYKHVLVKEWAAYKGKAPQTPELIEALPFREWTCPNLKKLWLGKAVEDKNRRMRAFLACMRSDTPAMVNAANIPSHLLVFCCVLRFMLQWPGIRVLRRIELDAFLAQALSFKLYQPEQLLELKIGSLDRRGIQVAALFISGVDMAIFANDACGQPVPWEHCCPWMFFDGRLFQSKLIRASQGHAQLIDLCDGQVDLMTKVEKMRESILEGLNTQLHPTLISVPPVHTLPLCPPHPLVPPQLGRGKRLLKSSALPSRGGKLEIAGTVVGQWAGAKWGRGGFPVQVVSLGRPNRGCTKGIISTPVFRTFGRGGLFYARTFKNQAAHLRSKPAEQTMITNNHTAKKERNVRARDSE